MNKMAIVIHGGAGTFPQELFTEALRQDYCHALLEAVDAGWKVLEDGGSALDAVERSVCVLEDCPYFNAGRGSVFNELGEIECDAAIMDGLTNQAGAVALVRGVKNPVSLARAVMHDGRSLFLVGEGAMRFAEKAGVEFAPESYFKTERRWQELEKAKEADAVVLDHTKFGTVGAVACDATGAVAAATSTGGLTNKAQGRIGDAPLIGAGTYANNASCAISCTGVGEIFIRHVVAHEISSRVLHGGQQLEKAVHGVVHDLLAPADGIGGVIAVTPGGEICLDFNSEGMFRGGRTSDSGPFAAIFS
jgi:beta-aspartyl-peptidase (threonine type)